MEDKFVHIMKRPVKRDSMYSWSRSIVDKKDENPFGMDKVQLILLKMFTDGKVFNGKYSDIAIWISKVNTRTLENYGTFNEEYIGHKNLYLKQNKFKLFKR